MEKKLSVGRPDRPRLVHSDERAQRDPAGGSSIRVMSAPRDGQNFVKLVKEFEKLCKDNAVGNSDLHGVNVEAIGTKAEKDFRKLLQTGADGKKKPASH